MLDKSKPGWFALFEWPGFDDFIRQLLLSFRQLYLLFRQLAALFQQLSPSFRQLLFFRQLPSLFDDLNLTAINYLLPKKRMPLI
jgi:hypothetical protein